MNFHVLDLRPNFRDTYSMSATSFTIDLQEKYVRVGDAQVKGDKIELLSLGVKPGASYFFSSETQQMIDQQTQAISSLVTSLKIKKRIANVIVPDSVTYSQILEMPQLKERELLSAIRYQSDEFIPMPIDETNLDIEILREDHIAKKILVLIVAAPKKTVAQIEKAIELSGLMPGNLENELTAMGRLLTEKMKFPPKQTSTLIFNFGSSASSIYLVDGKSSIIVFTRNIKIGLDLFLKDVKVNLNMDDLKSAEMLKSIGFSQGGSYNLESLLQPLTAEIAAEIQKILVIAKDRFNTPVDTIYLYNFDHCVAHFDKKIAQLTRLPTSSFPIGNILTQNPISQSFAPEISSFVSIVADSL